MNKIEYLKKYYQQNKKKLLQRAKEYYQKNKSKKQLYDKEYYQLNEEKIIKRKKLWWENNIKRISKIRKKSYQLNKSIINAYRKHKLHTNSEFRMIHNLRNRLNKVLGGNPKLETTMKLVGCSIEQLKKHLEKRFTKGMTWQNYGQWHIDHIKPCADFDLSKLSEQKKCFHYKNLQPLWALDNIKKGKNG